MAVHELHLPQQCRDEGRLARADLTNDGHQTALRNLQVDAAKDRSNTHSPTIDGGDQKTVCYTCDDTTATTCDDTTAITCDDTTATTCDDTTANTCDDTTATTCDDTTATTCADTHMRNPSC